MERTGPKNNQPFEGPNRRFPAEIHQFTVKKVDYSSSAEIGDQELLQRIVCDPKTMVGKPVIKGTRVTVEYILNFLARGSTVQEILDEYEGLTREDIRACLLFASQTNAPGSG